MHNRALAQIGARVYTRRATSGAADSQWRAAGSFMASGGAVLAVALDTQPPSYNRTGISLQGGNPPFYSAPLRKKINEATAPYTPGSRTWCRRNFIITRHAADCFLGEWRYLRVFPTGRIRKSASYARCEPTASSAWWFDAAIWRYKEKTCLFVRFFTCSQKNIKMAPFSLI